LAHPLESPRNSGRTIVGWWLLDKVDIIEVLKRPVAPYLPGGKLIFTSPAEPFMLTLKVAFALGCLVASPVIIYQIGRFSLPRCNEREKRLMVPALAVGVVLFLAGAIACYQWLLPAAAEGAARLPTHRPDGMITIDRYCRMAIPFRRRLRPGRRAATGGDDSRGARHRDATVPETAAALCDRGLPRSSPRF